MPMIRCLPMPPGAPQKFDAYAGSYEALHAASIAGSGEPTEYFAEYKLACLKRLGAPTAEPILDFGAGTGNLTEQLVKEFRAVTAYDPSAESLAQAKRRAPAATTVGTEEGIPDGTFATAVLSGVLHHVPPPERPELVARVRRKLRPGGRLFVFEHNPLNPLTRRAVHLCPFDDDAVLLYPWQLRPLLSRAGYAVERVDYIVFFPRALSRLRPLEPYLRRVVVGAQTLTVARNPD